MIRHKCDLCGKSGDESLRLRGLHSQFTGYPGPLEHVCEDCDVRIGKIWDDLFAFRKRILMAEFTDALNQICEAPKAER